MRILSPTCSGCGPRRGSPFRYVPQVELYHLEGQSYPDELRRTVATYNGWLQTMTWDDDLTTLMTEFAIS